MSDEDLKNKINEIKGLNLHTWWGLGLSERMLDAIFGANRPEPIPEPNDEEANMAMLPHVNLSMKKFVCL